MCSGVNCFWKKLRQLPINAFLFTATIVVNLANLEGEESFDATQLGQADEVVQERICDDELILIKS